MCRSRQLAPIHAYTSRPRVSAGRYLPGIPWGEVRALKSAWRRPVLVYSLGTMTPRELSMKARQLVAKGAVLLDVRSPEEFREGHPEPARNIPVHELPQRLAEVGPPGTKVVVYCASGGRSAMAAEILAYHGYPDVFDLQSVSYW
jgi:phage shock protein E